MGQSRVTVKVQYTAYFVKETRASEEWRRSAGRASHRTATVLYTRKKAQPSRRAFCRNT